MAEWYKKIRSVFGQRELREIDLSKDEGLCMLPFVHFHVTQSGNVTPCCQAPWDEPLDKIVNGSMVELWNSEDYQRLRLEMLTGKKPEVCRRCYEKESSGWTSLREVSNEKYQHHQNRLNQAWESKGKLNEPPVYFDIRFSNVCNLKCRICGPWASSKWFEDAMEMGMADRKNLVIERPVEDTQDLIDQVSDLIDRVEEFYFAGGEPLMMEEHYRILDLLIESGKSEVRLTYNTNLSQLAYKGIDVLAKWKAFKNVDLAVSLDGYGSRLEYMRHPIKWQNALENLKKLQAEAGHVRITISPTISVFNVFHLPEFHCKLVDEGLIRVEDFVPTLLIDPAHYNIRILPDTMKDRVGDLYEKHLKWIGSHTPEDLNKNGHMIKQFRSVIPHLNDGASKATIESFANQVNRLDKLRGEHFSEVFPELAELVQG